MSLVVIDESVHVGESFWSNTAVKFVLGYYSLTVSLTIIATGLLLARLLMIKRRTVRALGIYLLIYIAALYVKLTYYTRPFRIFRSISKCGSYNH